MAKKMIDQLAEAAAKSGLEFVVFGKAEVKCTINCPHCGAKRSAFVLRKKGERLASYGACLNTKCRKERGKILFPVSSVKGRLVAG
jgi:hypothetical protein